VRRPTIVLLVGSLLVSANAGIALAKGPESVTLAGPGIESPVELMDAIDWPISCDSSCPPDPMVQLMEQSGLWYATGDLPVPIDPPVGVLGNQDVLTWDRGGYLEENIRQFIYLDAKNGPVIHTPPQKGLEGWGSGVVGWFRASDDLADTLASLVDPLSATERAGSAAIGDPQYLGLLAVIGSALLVLIWANRRRSYLRQSF
jgi:hypothetical protein